MKLTMEQIKEIIDYVHDYTDRDIEINGPGDYDVNLYIDGKYTDDLKKEIEKVLKSDLEQLFNLQTKFQEKVKSDPDYRQESWEQHIRLMFIGIVTEACEALEQTNWKPWKRRKCHSQSQFNDEIVDIWHFLINLTLASGMDTDELMSRFLMKNRVNVRRQEEKY